MKLPDFLDFAAFNTLRQTMGAHELGEFVFFDPHLNLTGYERLSLRREGLVVAAEDFYVAEDSTLVYKDSRVLVYCPTPVSSHDWRFHLADCPALTALQAAAFEGWQARSDTPRSLTGRYQVCSDCLQRLRYQDYDSQRHRHRGYSERIEQEFELAGFFRRYPLYPVSRSSQVPIF